jgi:hypothetical protein
MKIAYKPTPEEVRKKRKEEYLSRYPVEVQMEALTEAAMGRPEKLNELTQGLAEIRGALPFAEEE